MNHKLSDLEGGGGGGGGLDGLSEEEHLREIWRELGVGVSGYLTVSELSTVCQHIGMEEMNDEVSQWIFFLGELLNNIFFTNSCLVTFDYYVG